MQAPGQQYVEEFYKSAGGWKTAFTAENGERTSIEEETKRTDSGAKIETGEAVFAVRQRNKGQSGVEHEFVLPVFSLLHASQHALVDTYDACAETNEEMPVKRKRTTNRSAKLMIFKCFKCAGYMVHYTAAKEKSNQSFQ